MALAVWTGSAAAAIAQTPPCVPPLALPAAGRQLDVGTVPATLRPGDRLTLQLTPGVRTPAEITAVCFDGEALTPLRVDAGASGTGVAPTVISLAVPGDAAAGPLPPRTRKVTIVLQGTAGPELTETTLIAPVTLTGIEVPVATPANTAFRVVLKGAGFDPARPIDHRVRMSRTAGTDLDAGVCWTDVDCAAKKSGVRGSITSEAIELTGLDPGVVRMSKFSVCRLETCSSPPLRDPLATELLWVPAVAFAGAVLMSLAVIFLVTRARPLQIESKRYVTSAMFIDKETNTYSLSKLQFYLWTFVAVFGYLELLISRWWLQGQWSLPALPSGLPGIVALAAGTSMGSQLVTSVNGPKGSGQTRPTLADFVTSGEAVAADRVQFFVWTVVGSLGYLTVLTAIDPRVLTELPEVPWSILSISGISALGYLGGKFARQPGPVINEITVQTGPDPAAPRAPSSAPGTNVATTSSPDAVEAMAVIGELKAQLLKIRASATVQPAIDAANRAIEAAMKAIAARAAADTAAAQTAGAEAEAQAETAGQVVLTLAAAVPPEERTQATLAASVAQRTAQAVQRLTTAAASSGAGPAPLAPATTAHNAAAGPFGLIELRGRTLSPDATFRISRGPDPESGEVPVTFDRLQPAPAPLDAGGTAGALSGGTLTAKPRVLEPDETKGATALAKRLLLVVRLDTPEMQAILRPTTKHVLTITNPDSQKAMLPFTVPDTQKPS